MRQLPLPVLHAELLKFAVATSYIEVIGVNCATNKSVASDRHGSSVDAGGNVKDADLTTFGSYEQHGALAVREGVVAEQARIRQLHVLPLHHVLHAGDIELQLVNDNRVLVPCHQSVARVLRIRIGEHVAPNQDGQGFRCYARVNGRTISGVPNDECVIFANASKETLIRRECQLLH